jgi:hypothetical protein
VWEFRSEVRNLAKDIVLPRVRLAFNSLVMNTAGDRKDPKNLQEFSESLVKAIRAKRVFLGIVDGTEAKQIFNLEEATFEESMEIVAAIRLAAISEVAAATTRFGDTSDEDFEDRIEGNMKFVEQACTDALELVNQTEKKRNATA